MTDTKLNKAITLGEAKLRVQEEAKWQKNLKLNKEVIQELKEYIFGQGENPLKDIQDEKEKNLADIEARFIELLKDEK